MPRFTTPQPKHGMPDDGVAVPVALPAGLIVMPGEHPRDPWRWWRMGDGGLASEHGFTPGDDALWSDAHGEDAALGRVVALMPAALAPVRIKPLGDMPAAQAISAARLSPDGLDKGEDAHIAAAVDDGHVLSCAVANSDMDVFLAELAAVGLDAEAIVPAALVLPAAGVDELQIGELGGQRLARTQAAGFAGEPDLVAALSGDARQTEAGADVLADRLAEVWRNPPLDLRQGAYARPRVSFFRLPDWGQLARMAAILALLGGLILLVETVRLELDTNAREEAAIAAARERFPAVTDLASAEAQVNAELIRRGAGGASFGAVAPAVFSAMQPVPNVQLRSLAWQGDGTLAIRAAAPRIEDVNTMLLALQADGWVITVPPETAPDATGAAVADITVRAP